VKGFHRLFPKGKKVLTQIRTLPSSKSRVASLLFAWVLSLYFGSMPHAHSIPFFKYQNLTLTNNVPTESGVLAAIRSRIQGMTDAQIVAAAMHGQFGACTYADAVGPISTIAWGFIKVGKDKNPSVLALYGPKVGTSTSRIASSGIVYKSTIRNLMKSDIRNFYGTSNTNRDSQVAAALKELVADTTDPCKLATYANLQASEMLRMQNLAADSNNIIFKKIGTDISPGECAIRVNKVPVSNLSLYLDGASTSGGCAFVLRKLPERFCLWTFVNDRANIVNARALTDTRFNASLSLVQTLNSIPAPVLASMTHTVPTLVGVKALLDMDLQQTGITGWVDPRTQLTSCVMSPNAAYWNAVRTCSFFGTPCSCTGCDGITPISSDVRQILKLFYTHEAKTPGDANHTPGSLFSNSTRFRQMIRYYSGITGGGDNNVLSGAVSGLDAQTIESIGTTNLPRSPAVAARRMPIDLFPTITEVALAQGATKPYLKAGTTTVTPAEINCDSASSTISEPRNIDQLSNTYAPYPVEPDADQITWRPNNAAQSATFQSWVACTVNCGCLQ
jgi:hypothetical protein